MPTSSFDLTVEIKRVQQAARAISVADAVAQRSKALRAIASVIADNQDDILEANTLDLEISRDMAVPDLVVDWLKLTPERIHKVVSIFRKLALAGADYVGTAQSGNALTQYCTCPVGTVGFIYEAFPDLSAIAAALCLSTGNALVLRGGGEASRTNRIIADLMRDTLETVGLPPTLILLADPTEISRQDVSQCSDIDLIITHGRPSLVEQVVQQASVPVIPSRMGNCYLYWAASGSLDTVYHMAADSHSGTPDAINRVEKILIHQSHSPNAIGRLWNRLQESGFEVVADRAVTALCSASTAEETDAIKPSEWSQAYLKKKIALRQVSDISEAIETINRYSSGHADSIVTNDYVQSRQFAHRCRSASIYVNASPRFIRDAEKVNAIALGTSNYKGTTGGLIGIEALQVRQRICHSV